MFDLYLNFFFEQYLPLCFLGVSAVFVVGIFPIFIENSQRRKAIRSAIGQKACVHIIERVDDAVELSD